MAHYLLLLGMMPTQTPPLPAPAIPAAQNALKWALIAVLSTTAAAWASPEPLQPAALRWVAELTGQPADSLTMRPLDERLTIKDCSGSWQFDMPFGAGQAVRARCPRPSQQIFLSLEKRPSGLDRLNEGRPARGAAAGAQRSQESSASKKLVLVAAQNIAANAPLSGHDFELKEVGLQGPEKEYFTEASGLEFSQLVRPLKAGEALRSRDLRQAVLIRRGDLTTLTLSRVPGLSIQVRVEAQQDGRFGEQIRFKNTESGRITMGEVIARGQAQAI